MTLELIGNQSNFFNGNRGIIDRLSERRLGNIDLITASWLLISLFYIIWICTKGSCSIVFIQKKKKWTYRVI